MDNQFIEIEQFAKLSGLSVSTIRRKIKSLSESNKNAFIRRVPVVGSGGEKILISKAWLSMMNKHEYATNDDVSKHDDEPLTDKKDDIQEQIKTPEQSPNDENTIIELLKKQIADKDREIEHRSKENDIKNAQIYNLSEANKELIERLKEVNYTLANAQKQLSAPVEDKRPGDLKWWQFWK